MKLRHTITIATLAATAMAANAAVINLSGMNGTAVTTFQDYALTTDTGTATQSGNGTGATPQNITYTVSGLTLDGVNSADDSIDLLYTISSSGGAITAHSVGSWGDGAINMAAAGTYIQVDFVSATVNLGAGATEPWTASAVLTYAEFGNFNGTGESGILNGTTYTNGGAADDGLQVALAPGTTTAKMEWAAGSWNFGHFGSQVTAEAVPEPSSTALLGLGGLALLLRRRR